MKSLIDFMGGANTFESRLDLMVNTSNGESGLRDGLLISATVQAKHVSPGPRRKWCWYNDAYEYRVC